MGGGGFEKRETGNQKREESEPHPRQRQRLLYREGSVWKKNLKLNNERGKRNTSRMGSGGIRIYIEG